MQICIGVPLLKDDSETLKSNLRGANPKNVGNGVTRNRIKREWVFTT